MVNGTLPWSEIRKEVVIAIRNYMKDEHGQMKSTVTLPYLVDYIYNHGDTELYPHLTGITWDMIEARCGKAIRSMKWNRFSKRVYAIPYGPRGGIEDSIPKKAEA